MNAFFLQLLVYLFDVRNINREFHVTISPQRGIAIEPWSGEGELLAVNSIAIKTTAKAICTTKKVEVIVRPRLDEEV